MPDHVLIKNAGWAVYGVILVRVVDAAGEGGFAESAVAHDSGVFSLENVVGADQQMAPMLWAGVTGYFFRPPASWSNWLCGA